MPAFQKDCFVTNAVVEKDGEKIFVEADSTTEKWLNGGTCTIPWVISPVCGYSPQHEGTLMQECGKAGGVEIGS